MKDNICKIQVLIRVSTALIQLAHGYLTVPLSTEKVSQKMCVDVGIEML